ncbi:EAL domain-containing protein [Rhizobium sp. TRM95111]|uniref:sensor domain-containing protein n=1 Tax=Rhizobium alarense TaxID=2846851 RepID=UPI001F43B916|nr:GGDEF and EAL domain-containing protein [Rhizobium alarense]MCF3642740.1 EAL domain-containing protein [Rhizobium alarense]
MKSSPPSLKASPRAGRTGDPSMVGEIADDVATYLGLGHSDDAVALLSALRHSIHEKVPSSVKLGISSNPAADVVLEFDLSPQHDHGKVRRDRETFFEALLETLPLPVFYKNRQGHHMGCNRAFEDFFGDKRENIIGKSIFDLVPTHVANLHAAKDELLFEEGGTQQYETKVFVPNGGQYDAVFNKAVFVDDQGEAAGIVCAMLDITERKQTEQNLKEALEFAEGMIAAIPDILFEVDADGRYLQVWTKSPELLAQQRGALLGRTIGEVLPPDQVDIAMEAIREADEGGTSYGSCLRITLPSGETRWFEHSVAKRPSTDLTASTFLVLSRDVTERKQAEEAVDAVRSQLHGVLQTIPDIVWLKSVEGPYLLCNHAFERLTGYAEADVVGKTDYDLFDVERAQYFCDLDRATVAAGRVIVEEEWAAHKDSGERIRLETRKVPVFGPDGIATAILGVARDITELNASRQKIHQMAFYDPLTALPNRALFNDRLRQMIADAASNDLQGAVMLIDIDDFKRVNDTMGHPVGDELLCQAAERLKASVRDRDTVARLGGDEFAILLPEIRQEEDVSRIAGRMLENFNERFLLDGKEVFASCSIGIAFCPDDSSDADDLVRYADSAMYLAKRSGRNNFRFYSRDLTASAEERLMLESELRRAIERGELELHYQPKVLLQNGTMFGSEALLRWRHPKRGMIPPDQFIRIAEETELITDLGRWVLREACGTAAELNADDLPLHKVAINLSAREFQSQDLPKAVAACLENTGCRAEWIEIEITESLLLDEKDRALGTLRELRAMGISIAIDDFGTGYSALNYLARFPIDTLKIDRSFINGADKRSSELVKAILSIARCLGQSVVAEGVETVEQAAFLAANGCEAAQGFLYSKPKPKSEIMKLLRPSGDIGQAS